MFNVRRKKKKRKKMFLYHLQFDESINVHFETNTININKNNSIKQVIETGRKQRNKTCAIMYLNISKIYLFW